VTEREFVDEKAETMWWSGEMAIERERSDRAGDRRRAVTKDGD